MIPGDWDDPMNEETLKNTDENYTDDQWRSVNDCLSSHHVFHALPLPSRDLGGMCEHRLASNGHPCGGQKWAKNGLHRSRLLIRWLMIILVNLWCLSYELLVHVLRNEEKKPSKIILILSSAYLTLFLRATAGPGFKLDAEANMRVSGGRLKTLCGVFAGQRCPGYLRMCGKKDSKVP